MTQTRESDDVVRMPEWEYQLRLQAASPDHDITEFASASFTPLLVAAARAGSRAGLVDRIRRVRAKVDEELVDDVRYDEFRDLLWAGCVWWRIEDPEPTPEQYASYVKVKGLRGPSRERRNLNRRTFRHAWAGYHYRRGVQGERGSSDLLGRDERAGRSEPLKSRIQDALVALLYAIVDGDDVTAFWDPAGNTLRRPRPDSGAAVDDGTDSTAATAQLRVEEVEEGEPQTGEESQDVQVDLPSRASGPRGVLERSWDAVRRHPGWTGVGALVAAMLVVAIVGASTQWFGFVPSADETPSGVIGLPAADEEGHQIAPATWGPTDRDVVSVQSRNSVVTLNSMVDNPVQGDERNFMQIRPSAAGNESYTDELVLTPGDVYVGFVYFKNDASADAEGAVAKNTRLKLEVPGVVHGSANAYARLSSDNAVPGEVWDGVTLVLPAPNQEAALRYVSGSATLHTGGAADGTPLDDALFGPEGVLLGCDALDGNLPSRDECGGYVTFELRVDQPAFTVAASARLKGSTDPFASQIVATVGDVLDVRVTYQNTGTNQQDNVTLKIHDLPEGFRYVKESSQIANSTTGGDYHDTIDGVTTNGYNLGSYQPKGNVFFKFDLIIDESMLADDRGSRWIELPSFARITTNAGYIDAPLTLTLLRDSVPTTSALDATDPDYWRASWGPQREMYFYQSGGAPYPVFNSISDNPNIGDERNFVGLRLDDGSDGDHVWYDHVWAKPGETYLMRVYVNNAGADSNDAYEAGRLQGVRLQAGTSRSKTGTEASVYGLLTAKQKPSPVWDGATFHFDAGVDVVFDTDYGAVIANNAHGEGLQLGPEAFSSEGVPLGYEQMDGVIRPGYQYASYVTYRIRVIAGQSVNTATSKATWGPEREMFTVASGGAPYPVFNSISDNPNYGDERNFLTVKRSGTSYAGGWLDEAWVNPGEGYSLRIYGENTGQDAAAAVPAGSLQDARLKITLESEAGTHTIRAELTSANAETVWDSVVIHTRPDVTLAIEDGAFELTTNAHPRGTPLAGDVTSTNGALLGHKDQDGIIKPGYKYSFLVHGAISAHD